MSQIDIRALLDDGSHEASARQLRLLAADARQALKRAGDYGQQLLEAAADETVKGFPTPLAAPFATIGKAQDSVPSADGVASDQRLIEAWAVLQAVQGIQDRTAIESHRRHNEEVFGNPRVKSVDGAMNCFRFYAANVALRQLLAPLVTQAAKAITTIALPNLWPIPLALTAECSLLWECRGQAKASYCMMAFS